MHHKPGEKGIGAGAILTVLGGIVVIGSFFLDWGKLVHEGQDFRTKGGGVVLAVGAVIIVLGIVLTRVRTRGAATGTAVAVLVIGIIATLVSLAALTNDAVIGSVTKDQATADTVKDLVDRGVDQVKHEPGVFLALLGSVLTLLGGAVALATRPKKTAMVSAGGAPAPGWGAQPAGPGAPPAQPGYGAPPAGGVPPPATPGAPPPPQQPGQPPQGGGFAG